MVELHCVLSKIFDRGVFVGLLLVALLIIGCFVKPSHAQSGIGVGLVFSQPHTGGLSVRYGAIQAMVDADIGGGVGTDGRDRTDINIRRIAVRYNHPVRGQKRVRFKVFGQVGRHKFPVVDQEPILPTLYQFTGGGSAELQIGRKTSSKGLFLTVDVGLSIDHMGHFGAIPARGIALHVFF